MSADELKCATCGAPAPRGGNGAAPICPRCGSSGLGGAAQTRTDTIAQAESLATARELAEELDFRIGEIESEIAAIKSKEQSLPLEIGCGLFGMFGIVMVVLAFFATVGRTFFGGSLFFIALAMVVLGGAARLRNKIKQSGDRSKLVRERTALETTLTTLRNDKEKLARLIENWPMIP